MKLDAWKPAKIILNIPFEINLAFEKEILWKLLCNLFIMKREYNYFNLLLPRSNLYEVKLVKMKTVY